MGITLISAPAAGKGLLSSMVSKEYGYPHISIGDLLRNVDDEAVKDKLANGKFVDNDIVEALLVKRLSKPDCKNGYILDGFPRIVSQIPIYEKICGDDNYIVVLDIPKEIGEARITGRRVCLNCGEVYNDLIESSKSKVSGVCDNCGHKLIKRSDDNLETYDDRYNTYLKETVPIIHYFESKGKVYHIDASGDKMVTFRELKKIIGGYDD